MSPGRSKSRRKQSRSGRASSPAPPGATSRSNGRRPRATGRDATARRRKASNPSTVAKRFEPNAQEQELVRDGASTRARGETRHDRASRFPIVGIGASAGGLEALEVFLRHVSPPSGMAFVVVQHLDPKQKGMLVELLQRATSMSVVQAEDGLRVAPDHVYVIPPNKDMSILDGVLHLLPQALPRGLNLPIDHFFRSLAEDQQERSVGVILSGMGSDGLLGVRAIKEKAGAAFVQALSSAKFDSMPRSVIDAGLADVVAGVEELPARILGYLQHTVHLERASEQPEGKEQGFEKVCILLRAHTGSDFSLYKRSTIHRRIERRMGLYQMRDVTEYVGYLRENPREIDLLFKELLIGVTSFFRDPRAWDHLKNVVMPALIDDRATGSVMRAWVAACSTGEEAYSLAIVFREVLDAVRPPKAMTLQIFATDLDIDAIEKARLAIYPESIIQDVGPERLRRFFVQEERGYRVSKDVREMVVFAPQNIIMDPPFTKLDILSCRNLLIYLTGELQKKLVPLFHYSLKPGGILFLGSAETVGTFADLFLPLDPKTRLHRRLDHNAGTPLIEFPSHAVPRLGATAATEGDAVVPRFRSANLQVLAERVLLQEYSPLGVLCNERGDILYISGRAGKYLEPAVGQPSLNLHAMARDGLRFDLANAFSMALREDRPVTVRDLQVTTEAGSALIDLTVQRLTEPMELRGAILVIIREKPAPIPVVKGKRSSDAGQPRVLELEQELHSVREEVQMTREEMQTSQEELKSTNEELQSTNEELQSSNEELTTSKEEMQSLNEELQTVNQELQAKVDELSRTNNDMKNLLNSTDIATLFLDGDLNVRRFTTPTSRIVKLIAADIGRPITDLALDLDYRDMADDAREVLRTLMFKERRASTRDGRWFVVKIMPYRTLENVIDGVVITFTDASAVKALEVAYEEQGRQFLQLADAMPSLIWASSPEGACEHLNARWVAYTGTPVEKLRGFRWLDHLHPRDREQVRDEWRAAVKSGRAVDIEFRLKAANGEYRLFRSRNVPIHDDRGAVRRWYGVAVPTDDRQR